MLIFLALLFGRIISGLRLHHGQSTPLQTSIKLGKFPIEAGTTLMSSLNTNKCFDSFVRLISVRTLRLRQFYQATCGSTEKTARNFFTTVWRQAAARNIRIGDVVGIECLANIRNFGIELENHSNARKWNICEDCPLTSAVKLGNFTPMQLKGLVRQVLEPTARYNVLSTSFLCPELDSLPSYLWDDNRLLDGQFIQHCPRIATSLITKLAIIDEVNLTTPHALPSDQIARLRKYLSTSTGILDLLSRFLKVGALSAYALSSWHRPETPNSLLSALMTLRVTISDLLEAKKVYAVGENDTPGLFDIISEMVRLRMYQGSNHFLLFNLLKTASCRSQFDVYAKLKNFINECIERDNLPLNSQLGHQIFQMKIDMLAMLLDDQQEATMIEEVIDELLDRSNLGFFGDFRIPVRSLLDLLFLLSTRNSFSFTPVCRKLTAYIISNMTPGSDLSVLRDLKADKYLPLQEKRKQGRLRAAWMTGDSGLCLEQKAGYWNRLVELTMFKLPYLSHLSELDTKPLDLGSMRKCVLRLICKILQLHFEYCGHSSSSGRPVFIQSLRCHPFIHSLFLRLILHANALRIRLPFDLHPSMKFYLSSRSSEILAKNYLNYAYSFGMRALEGAPENKVRSKLEQIPCLWRHLAGNNSFYERKQDTETDYLKWVALLNSPDRDMTHMTLAVLRTHVNYWVNQFGVHLAAACFTNFCAREFLGINVTQQDGLAIIFNHI